MGFRFSDLKAKFAASAKPNGAPSTRATSLTSTASEQLSASPELEAAVNQALNDVELSGAETLVGQLMAMTTKFYSEIGEITNKMAGHELQRVYWSKKDPNHVIVVFADESAISVQMTVSTLKELDEKEGEK